MAVTVVAFFVMAFRSKDRPRKSFDNTFRKEDPNIARLRQMAEWDRFDKKDK